MDDVHSPNEEFKQERSPPLPTLKRCQLGTWWCSGLWGGRRCFFCSFLRPLRRSNFSQISSFTAVSSVLAPKLVACSYVISGEICRTMNHLATSGRSQWVAKMNQLVTRPAIPGRSVVVLSTPEGTDLSRPQTTPLVQTCGQGTKHGTCGHK